MDVEDTEIEMNGNGAEVTLHTSYKTDIYIKQ
jgi:hypothetical protein